MWILSRHDYVIQLTLFNGLYKETVKNTRKGKICVGLGFFFGGGLYDLDNDVFSKPDL